MKVFSKPGRSPVSCFITSSGGDLFTTPPQELPQGFPLASKGAQVQLQVNNALVPCSTQVTHGPKGEGTGGVK